MFLQNKGGSSLAESIKYHLCIQRNLNSHKPHGCLLLSALFAGSGQLSIYSPVCAHARCIIQTMVRIQPDFFERVNPVTCTTRHNNTLLKTSAHTYSGAALRPVILNPVFSRHSTALLQIHIIETFFAVMPGRITHHIMCVCAFFIQ